MKKSGCFETKTPSLPKPERPHGLGRRKKSAKWGKWGTDALTGSWKVRSKDEICDETSLEGRVSVSGVGGGGYDRRIPISDPIEWENIEIIAERNGATNKKVYAQGVRPHMRTAWGKKCLTKE